MASTLPLRLQRRGAYNELVISVGERKVCTLHLLFYLTHLEKSILDLSVRCESLPIIFSPHSMRC